MTRIPQASYDQIPDASRELWDQQITDHGRMTNMKRTLAHSPVAFAALMTWYPLRDLVLPSLGVRLTNLFAHAVSSETDCLICSTFFRRIIQESGEDPDRLAMSPKERAITTFGQELARNKHRVSNETYAGVAHYLNPHEILNLTAFGALMVATNVINNVLDVELDAELERFRAT